MHRFFSSSSNICGDKITIADKNQIHHLKDVLRFKTGDGVIIFDDKGNEYNSIIEKVSDQSISFKIKDRHKIIPCPKPKITVACAIPKKSKMDDIVDKLTQLGVDRIIPLKTERVIMKLDKDKEFIKLKRWKKIALTATEQARRSTLPIIEPPKEIKEVLTESKAFDLKLIAVLSGDRKSLRETLDNNKPSIVKFKDGSASVSEAQPSIVKLKDGSASVSEAQPSNILIFIGPEGDFTPEEIVLAKSAGCIPISLGDLVLRVETAAISVVSFIRLYDTL